MKESDKNMENLIDKMMTENALQAPSIDFTSKIMSQVLASEKNKIEMYKPLISKQIWMLVIGVLIALTVYSVIEGGENNLKISGLYYDKFSNLFSGFRISKNILYAVLVVPFMVLIQILMLKNYYNKRCEL